MTEVGTGRRRTTATILAKMPGRTLRLRLTLLYGTLFLGCGAMLLAFAYVLVDRATGSRLVVQVGGSGRTVVVAGPTPPPPVHGVPVHGSLPPAVGVLSGKDQIVIQHLNPAQAAAQAHALQAQAAHDHGVEMHGLLVDSGLALVLMAFLAMALGWLVAGRVLKPLRTITSTAREITATNLHRRLGLGGPADEVRELGDTFDDLLERLESSFRSQRRFVGNASHELRSPLARQRAVIQVALGDPDATIESLREAHEKALAAGVEQERIIEALLTLSRSQAGLDTREGVDLATVADEVVLAREGEIVRSGLVLDTRLGPARLGGDRRLAERLVANLIDNALRYNATGGKVEVETGVRDGGGGVGGVGGAYLSVVNDGVKIDAGEVAGLFEPFRKLRGERTGHGGGDRAGNGGQDGTGHWGGHGNGHGGGDRAGDGGQDGTGHGLGLGLSIVAAIADAHGAQVSAVARPEGGLAIEVTFPAPATASAWRAGDLGAGERT